MSSAERSDDSNSADGSGKTDESIHGPSSDSGEASSVNSGFAKPAGEANAVRASKSIAEGSRQLDEPGVAEDPSTSKTPVSPTELPVNLVTVASPEPGQESATVKFIEKPSRELNRSLGEASASFLLRGLCASTHVTTITAWLALGWWSTQAPLSLPFYIFFSLTTYHSAALGLWLGIGRPWWRWVVIPAAATTLVIAASRRASPNYWEYALYCFGIVASTACLVFLLRLSGRQLINWATGQCESDSLRFGIRHLIVWTCGVAVLLGLLRGFGIEVDIAETWRSSRDTVGQIVRLVFTTCLPAVVSLWVWLGQRLSVWKFLLVIVVAGLAMFVSHESEIAIFPVAVMISQGILTLLLVLYRLRGFRLINLDRSQKEQSEIVMEQA